MDITEPKRLGLAPSSKILYCITRLYWTLRYALGDEDAYVRNDGDSVKTSVSRLLFRVASAFDAAVLHIWSARQCGKLPLSPLSRH